MAKVMGAALVVMMGTGATAWAQQQPGTAPGEPGAGKEIVVDAGAKVPGISAPDRERVLFLLRGYEYFPTRADLDAVAPAEAMAPLLRELAGSADSGAALRLRSVDALGYYKDEATRALLREWALKAPTSTDKGMLRFEMSRQHHAITSLAKAGGEQEVAFLSGLLKQQDVQLQLTAISALGKHGGAKGRAVLEALSKEAPGPVIQRELRKHLG